MKYGLVFPKGDPRTAADFAHVAEKAGWDGFFVWEPIWGFDAWVMLAAAAMQTNRLRLGTMITPLSRMRPWELASKSVALDHLSKGRTIISIGLGAIDNGFDAFGEKTDRRTRAELLDEGLEILTGLWHGQPFSLKGKHYTIKETKFYPPPPPIQQPRIPIWVVGAWQRPRSMRRALRYDGIIPTIADPSGGMRNPNPDEIPRIKKYIETERSSRKPFEIVVEGRNLPSDEAKAREAVRPWAEAGATWFIATKWAAMDNPKLMDEFLDTIGKGPPKV
jgi:alkanesulfonate monooxygenase SsuD/methylene tetrahydromethanopterin reductase-like flavin-dependent oxidoreductase (luciferase family)